MPPGADETADLPTEEDERRERTLNDLFQMIKDGLQRDGVRFKLDQEVEFTYKDAPTFGKAIHIAALREDGAPVVSRLLELRASVETRCHQIGHASKDYRERTFLPLHLAAGQGSEDTVRILLDARADISAKTTSGGQEHYTALHEAAFFADRLNIVGLLLHRRADPNARNVQGMTPLHVAAKQDTHDTAQDLIRARADIMARDHGGKTGKGKRPLELALESQSFSRSMHILCGRNIEEIKLICNIDTSVGAGLLKDHRVHTATAIHPSWTEALLKPEDQAKAPCVEDIVELLGTCPQAALDVLDSLTVKPKVKNQFEYPLRRKTFRAPFERLRAAYRWETEWALQPGKVEPCWHTRLLPKSPPFDPLCPFEGAETVRAKVRILKLVGASEDQPGVVCNSRLLHALLESDGCVFLNSAVQAILDYTWVNLVRRAYTVVCAIVLLEVIVLGWAALWTPRSELAKRVTWSWVAGALIRDILSKFSKVFAYRHMENSIIHIFGNPWNYVDVASTGFYAALVAMTAKSLQLSGDDPANREILCLVCLNRWAQLIFRMHAFRFHYIGYELVPIIQSFFRIAGISLIAGTTFLAFAHANIALNGIPMDASLDTTNSTDSGGTEYGAWDVIVNTLRLLLLEDGNGIDMELSLGGATSQNRFTFLMTLLATCFFCICILNLFIAVHGDEYATAKSNLLGTFYTMRCRVCLSGMLDATSIGRMAYWQDAIARKCCMRRRGMRESSWSFFTYFVVVLPGVAIWFGLLFLERLHPIIPAGILAVSLRIGDVELKTRLALGDRDFESSAGKTSRTHPGGGGGNVASEASTSAAASEGPTPSSSIDAREAEELKTTLKLPLPLADEPQQVEALKGTLKAPPDEERQVSDVKVEAPADPEPKLPAAALGQSPLSATTRTPKQLGSTGSIARVTPSTPDGVRGTMTGWLRPRQTVSPQPVERPEPAVPHHYLWWASWDLEDDEVNNLTSVAAEVHESKKQLDQGLSHIHKMLASISKSGASVPEESSSNDPGPPTDPAAYGVAGPLAQRLDATDAKVDRLQQDVQLILERLNQLTGHKKVDTLDC